MQLSADIDLQLKDVMREETAAREVEQLFVAIPSPGQPLLDHTKRFSAHTADQVLLCEVPHTSEMN